VAGGYVAATVSDHSPLGHAAALSAFMMLLGLTSWLINGGQPASGQPDWYPWVMTLLVPPTAVLGGNPGYTAHTLADLFQQAGTFTNLILQATVPLPLLIKFPAGRRPPGRATDLAEDLTEPFFCKSDLRLHNVLFADASLQIEIQPVESANHVEKLHDLGPEHTESAMADPAVRQDVEHWGDPQAIRRIDDRNQEERSDQHPERRGDVDVHRYHPQKESEKEHG